MKILYLEWFGYNSFKTQFWKLCISLYSLCRNQKYLVEINLVTEITKVASKFLHNFFFKSSHPQNMILNEEFVIQNFPGISGYRKKYCRELQTLCPFVFQLNFVYYIRISIGLQLCVRLRVFLSEVPFLHESVVYILTSQFTKFDRK